ncbi:MAG: hypothetical protein WCX84_01240 [Syntrophales bacterium]|jgi:hypothetical protein
MTIKQIQIPVGGQRGDDPVHRYALYFGSRLKIPLQGIGIDPTHTGGQPSSMTGHANDSLFEELGRAWPDQNNPSCQTRSCHASWASAFEDPDSLTILPFGKHSRPSNLTIDHLFSLQRQTVLCCPDHYIDIESIALSYDGGHQAKKSLELAVWLSEKGTWPLSVLLTVDNQEKGTEWLDEVERFLDTVAIDSTTIVLYGPHEAALHRFMRDGSVEMLILGVSGQSHCHAGSTEYTGAHTLSTVDYPLLLVF